MQSCKGPSGIYFLLFKSRISYIQRNTNPQIFVQHAVWKHWQQRCHSHDPWFPCLALPTPRTLFLEPLLLLHLLFLSLPKQQSSALQDSFTSLTSPLFPLISTHNSSRFSRFLGVLADIWLWQLLDHWLAWVFIHCISKGCCLKLRPGNHSQNTFLWIVFARCQYPAQIPL